MPNMSTLIEFCTDLYQQLPLNLRIGIKAKQNV